jgi:MFS family permease
MTTAWVLASVVAGQVIARLGRTRPAGVVGMALGAAGLWLMAGMGPGTEYTVVARNLVIVGLGLGAALAAFVVAAQNAVPVEQAGVATALNTFARALGGTLASAALGGLLTADLSGASSSGLADPRFLSSALSHTFTVSGALLAVGAVAALLVRDLPLLGRVSPQIEPVRTAATVEGRL